MSLVIGGVASPKANRTTLPSPSGFWQNLVHFLVFRIALMFGRRGTVKCANCAHSPGDGHYALFMRSTHYGLRFY